MTVLGGRDAQSARVFDRLAQQIDQGIADARVRDSARGEEKTHCLGSVGRAVPQDKRGQPRSGKVRGVFTPYTRDAGQRSWLSVHPEVLSADPVTARAPPTKQGNTARLARRVAARTPSGFAPSFRDRLSSRRRLP